jgi:hypothetical protein
MTLVLVERAFESPIDLAELRAREDRVAFCLKANRVKSLQSLVASDRRHMLCMYDAADAEAVRCTQRVAELSVEHVWPATVAVEHALPMPAGYSLVVVQRALPPGLTLEVIQQAARDANGCNDRLRVQHHAAYLSLDGRRMCCIYYSPDLESVRVSNREAGMPVERLWSAERIAAAD